MPRTRQLKHSFFLNEDLAECSPLARLLFQGLWVLADREGRLQNRPKKIKAQIFPYHEADVDGLLNGLSPIFIERYSVDGESFIEVKNFKKHQHIHPEEKPSIIPNPPEKTGGNRGKPGKTRKTGKKTSILPIKPSLSPSPSLNTNKSGEAGRAEEKKENGSTPPDETNTDHWRLADLLRKLMVINDPKARTPEDGTPSWQTWVKESERLLHRDKRPVDEAIKVLRWCQQDSFWMANIHSMPTFRQKYPKLRLQALRGDGGGLKRGVGQATPVPGKYEHLTIRSGGQK